MLLAVRVGQGVLDIIRLFCYFGVSRDSVRFYGLPYFFYLYIAFPLRGRWPSKARSDEVYSAIRKCPVVSVKCPTDWVRYHRIGNKKDCRFGQSF